MAGFAGDVGVGSGQGEVGLGVVVEEPCMPIDRVMAQRAVGPETPLVRFFVLMTGVALGRRIDVNVRLVARAAIRVRVPSEQRETGEVVIEEKILRPVDLAVAVVAGETLSAVVRIVLSVACVAVIAEGNVEYRLYVAKLALEYAMRTVQRVAGIERVIERYYLPLVRCVTVDAAAPEVLVVRVIVPVAGKAVRTQPVRKRVFAVTAATGLVRVCSRKRKGRISSVIEARIQPAGGLVAGLATLSATAVVRVIGSVTAVARCRSVPKGVISVTAKTFCLAMTSDQRVPRRVMIELDL